MSDAVTGKYRRETDRAMHGARLRNRQLAVSVSCVFGSRGMVRLIRDNAIHTNGLHEIQETVGMPQVAS